MVDSGAGNDPNAPVAEERIVNKIFKTVTIILVVALALSAALHLLLLTSDSPDYRRWVQVQIGIQIVGVGLLLGLLKRKLVAIFILFPLSIAFTYINAVYTNYGHTAQNIVGFIGVWLVYGTIVARGWAEPGSDREG